MSALVSLLLVFVLPAVAGAVLWSDTDDTAPGRSTTPVDIVLSRGVACGISTWLIGSGLLTRTVGLTSSSAWVWDALVAAVSSVVLLLPRQRARVRAGVRSVGSRAAAVVGLTTLVFSPLGYAIVHVSWSPLGSTPWYYYGLARQVAEAGSMPSTSIEFATTTPFLNDYHLFTTGTAMLLVQDPGGPIVVVTTVALTSVLLLGLGAVAAASALGAGRGPALLAIPPVLASGLAAIRLAAYRPEGLGLGLALLVLALSLDWFRRGDRRSLAAGAMLVAALSQVHGIAAVTTGVMVVAVALASMARRPRREPLRRAGIAVASYAVAVVVTGLVFREASGTTTSGGLVDRGGLGDPTWEFYRAARGDAPSMPPGNLDLLHQTVRDLYQGSWWWLLPLLLLAVYGVWRRRAEPATRFLVAFTLLTLLGVAIVASVFMFGWQGYVPRRTGGSRILLEASLLVPLLVAFGVGSLAGEGPRWRGRSLMRPERALYLVGAAASVVAIVSLVGVARYDIRLAPSRDDLALWRSLPVEPGDVVLTNGYTEGFVPDVTAGVGLLDGRAPYTFGSLMQRANGLLRGAHAFFDDPAAHWAFLATNHVRWVAVGDPHTYALSTGNTWYVPTSLQGLDGCAGLQRVATDGRLTVYRVVDPGPHGCAPARG